MEQTLVIYSGLEFNSSTGKYSKVEFSIRYSMPTAIAGSFENHYRKNCFFKGKPRNIMFSDFYNSLDEITKSKIEVADFSKEPTKSKDMCQDLKLNMRGRCWTSLIPKVQRVLKGNQDLYRVEQSGIIYESDSDEFRNIILNYYDMQVQIRKNAIENVTLSAWFDQLDEGIKNRLNIIKYEKPGIPA